jgi:eukaryotic-like serine/threonine-protein kinase
MTKQTHTRSGATLAVIPAHRDVSLDMMRSFIEIGEGGCWTIHAIAWSPDGQYWASAGADDTLRIWDTSTRSQIRLYTWNRRRGQVLDVVWSPDGAYIGALAKSASLYQVVVMRALTGEVIYQSAQHAGAELAWPTTQSASGASPRSIAVCACDPGRTRSGDGRYIMASASENPVEGEEASFSAPLDAMTCLWSPDGARNGRRVASGGVWILERASGRVMVSLPRSTSWVAWSPVGSRIASIQRRVVTVWEAGTGTLMCAYRGHVGHAGWFERVTCLSWSPSGQHIASGDSAGAIHLWQV